MITAQEARKNSESSATELTRKELILIEAKIIEACKKGKNEIILKQPISFLTKEQLTIHGYKVKISREINHEKFGPYLGDVIPNRFIEPSYEIQTIISW